MVIYLGKL